MHPAKTNRCPAVHLSFLHSTPHHHNARMATQEEASAKTLKLENVSIGGASGLHCASGKLTFPPDRQKRHPHRDREKVSEKMAGTRTLQRRCSNHRGRRYNRSR